MNIEEICTQTECGHIEYKSEWYWDLNDINAGTIDKLKLWGEFIKDILALINANIESFNKTRYMIVGYNEDKEEFSDFGFNQSHFENIKNKINSKLDSAISDFEYLDLKTYCYSTADFEIFVIKIEQPFRIHSLKRNVQTITTDYKENTVLYRGNVSSSNTKNDSVGVMHINHIRKLEDKIEKTYGSKFKSIETLRNKSIRNTVSSYLEVNSALVLSDGFPKENKKNKGYSELYELKNNLDDSKTYFAYISDSNMRSSIEGLHETFSKFANHKEKIILLVDKPKSTPEDQRLSYIKRIYEKTSLPVTTLDFIENFGKKYLYKQYLEPLAFEHDLPNTQNFIESFSSNSKNLTKKLFATELLNSWFIEENSPLVVLTGPGGVGKTTVVKNFLNKQLKNLQKDTDHYVLFLDSSSLLEQLKSDRVSTIYDLYKALSDDSNYFTEELFKLSIDNGSFIIILDGLDEIISGISVKFELQEFLKNIFEDYCFNLAKTKIILTCRDYIWEEAINLISEDYDIEKVAVLPFSIDQTKEFFASYFKDDLKLQHKSMNMVKELISKSNEQNYSPFMLDTVSELISEGTHRDDIDDIFDIDDEDSKKLCLMKNSMLDYLIYAVCKREEKKISINIVDQIKILCKLSEINKTIDKTSFSFIVKDVISNANDTSVTQLLAHAFIEFHTEKSIIIRYDFLRDFFLKVTVAQNIQDGGVFGSDLLSILVTKVRYLNHFSIDVGNRLFDIDPEILLLSILDNIDNLNKTIDDSQDKDLIKNCRYYISNIFVLYLGILKSMNLLKDSKDINTALQDVFSTDGNNLDKLYLCNIREINLSPKLIFNFCDLKINDCYIYNYHGFTECEFNSGTSFNTGSVDIKAPENANTSLKPTNFSKKIIRLGDTIDVLELIENSLIVNSKQKSETLSSFIKMFIKNFKFVPKKVAQVKGKKGSNIVKQMLSGNIILPYRNSKLNQDEYIINPDISDELHKFWDSGVVTPKIKKIIRSI